MKSAGFFQMAGLLAVTAMLGGMGTAVAQTATAPSGLKTIGTPAAAAKPEIVPSLFVLNSRGATLQGDTLTLTGVTPSSIIFADRPVRSAGHQPTADVIAEWGSGDDSFAKNPPNATLSVFSKDGSVKDAVVVLKNPKLEGDKLTFNVQILEGDIAGADGGAALFIDIIGRPFTPMSFAGVARRTAFRGAMYAGAVGAAAYGAAAYAHPYALSLRPPGLRLLSVSALLLRRGRMRGSARLPAFNPCQIATLEKTQSRKLGRITMNVTRRASTIGRHEPARRRVYEHREPRRVRSNSLASAKGSRTSGSPPTPISTATRS